MKKFLPFIILGVFGWKLIQGNNSKEITFNSSAESEAILFTGVACGSPCSDAKSVLSETSANIEEVVVNHADKASMARLEAVGGGSEVPVLVTSNGTRIDGFNEIQYLSAIADAAGLDSVPAKASQILGTHFEGSQPKVVMYATAWCPYCAKARKFMGEEGIAYEERDVEKNSDYMAMYKWLDSSGYPLIYYGAKRLQGFDAGKLQALLKQ